jgi:hypothetical protein
MADRPDMTIISKKEEACVMIDMAQSTGRNVTLNGRSKEIKLQEFMYRDETNVKCEKHDYTRNNWSHRKSDNRFK